MSRATALFRLQKTDAELDQNRSRLKAIDDILGDSPAIREAQRQVVELQTHFTTSRIRTQALDLETQTLSGKIADAEDRLYSGRVTHPRELRDLEQDIASLKRQRAVLEEQQLEALIRAEAAEAEFLSAQAHLARVESETATTHSSLLQEREEVKARLERLEAEREAMAAPVSPTDQELYERLRRTKAGRALALLDEGVCSACGVAPSSARIQSARQGNELIRCGNCDRILYSE